MNYSSDQSLCMTMSPDSLLQSSSWTLVPLVITIILGVLFYSSKQIIKTLAQENQNLKKTKRIASNRNNANPESKADISHTPSPPLSTDDTHQQITAALNNLFNELGYYEANDFVNLCIQELAQINEKLNQHILNKDWNAAKKVIHKLHGSSNLYASHQLQQILHLIDTDMISGINLNQAILEVQNQLTLLLDYMKKKVEP